VQVQAGIENVSNPVTKCEIKHLDLPNEWRGHADLCETAILAAA
jgi:hypothetical protein